MPPIVKKYYLVLKNDHIVINIESHQLDLSLTDK